MPSHRSLRIAEAIREVVSEAVLFHLADPRVKGVTVLRAEASGDLRHATVWVSVMGSDSEQKLAMKGLDHATGFLQSRVAARLQTRYTPALVFKLDQSVKQSIAISKLIDQAIASDRRPGDEAQSPAAGGDEVEAADEEDDIERAEEPPAQSASTPAPPGLGGSSETRA